MEFISPGEAARRLSIGRTKLWQLATRDPDFPKPVQITQRRIGYVKAEIEAWMEARAKARDTVAA